MKYLFALIVIATLSGCDHDENFIGDGTSRGAADSGAAQTPPPAASETLKVTYSKSDPFKAQSEKKKAMPDKMGGDGHDMKGMPGMDMKKEKSSQDMKPSHEEHPSK